jgi:NIMA (never in mitosis gene a)-related kinase
LKALQHPFIIDYIESFMDKKYSKFLNLLSRYLCIVMNYAEGGDMYTRIANQKKIGKGFPYY